MLSLPMLIVPSPPTRSSGDFIERSLLCATPFLMANVAFNSEKSVFSVLFACCTCSPRSAPSLARALRMDPAMLMPFNAPSVSRMAAVPLSAFLSADTVLPCAVRSTLTLPLPSSMSLSARSLTSGPTSTPESFCFTAKDGVAAALIVSAPASEPR